MIFSLLMLILVGVVAFFHYTQGFFSATISAVLVVLCAVFAVGYNEALVATVFKDTLPDQSHAIALVGVFALSYFLLRLAFDAAIPGNVRMPLIADKIGAGAMGLVAGLFTAGIVALAAQMLPFGPSIGGYARWELNSSREVRVPDPGGRTQDAEVDGDLHNDRIDYNAQKGLLLLPVDDLLVGTVAKLSDNGSLASGNPLRTVHPDLVGELNASRLGIQIGAKHTAYDTPKGEALSVAGVFTAPSFPQWDAEIPDVRGQREQQVTTTLKPESGHVLLIIPVKSGRDLGDSDNKVRFSPAAVRLKAGREGSEMNFHPIGTLEKGPIVLNDKDDDPLVAEIGKNVYLVFDVPAEDVLQNYDPKSKDWKLVPGAFLEFKRYAHADLSGADVNFATPSGADSGMLRKAQVLKAAQTKLGGAIGAPAATEEPKPATPPAARQVPAGGSRSGGGNVPGVENTVEGIKGGI